MASTKVSLKLLIDKSSNKVLFAEAGKDFIDFLFNLLSLPLGTIVRLLTKNGMVGCLANLYESVENLDDSTRPNEILSSEARICTSSSTDLYSFLLPANDEDNKSVTAKLYVCERGCDYYVTEDSNSRCPHCNYGTMDREAKFVGKVRTMTSFGGELICERGCDVYGCAAYVHHF